MSNRVNITDFIHDEPFINNGPNHGQYYTTRFCIKCHWNPSWQINPHEKGGYWAWNYNKKRIRWVPKRKPICDGEIISVPASIRFPKKTASKRTWKVFTLFLKRLPKLTEEEQINADRLKKLNQILYGGKKWKKITF